MSSLRHRSFSQLLGFARVGTATYCHSSGALVTAAENEPRVEYDPDTLAVRGLLIEPARYNFLLRSEEFDNASWSKIRASVTPSQARAPDGELSGDKLIEDTTAAESHYAIQVYTKGSTTEVQPYCFSVFVKAAERSALRLVCQGSSGSANSARANFDLVTGTVSVAPVISGQFDNAQAKIEKWGNGWYRCSLNFRVNNDGQAGLQTAVILLNSPTGSNYTGNGTSGLYLWGAQLEKGVHPTSYIPTTTVAIERKRDVCTVASLTPWFNETAGTIFVEYLVPWTYLSTDPVSTRRLAQADGGDETQRHLIYLNAGNVRGNTTTGNVQQTDVSAGTMTPGVVERVAHAWAENDVATIKTGNTIKLDTVASMPTPITTFRLGAAATAGTEPIAYLRKVRFYPRRLSNAELAALVA